MNNVTCDLMNLSALSSLHTNAQEHVHSAAPLVNADCVQTKLQHATLQRKTLDRCPDISIQTLAEYQAVALMHEFRYYEMSIET